MIKNDNEVKRVKILQNEWQQVQRNKIQHLNLLVEFSREVMADVKLQGTSRLVRRNKRNKIG